MEMARLDRAGNFLTPGLLDATEIQDRPDEEFFGRFFN